MERPKFFASSDSGPYTQSGFKINPNLSSFGEHWQSLDPQRRHVIEQYQAIAAAYDQLWQEIYPRTPIKPWEQDSTGLGSCDISEEFAAGGLDAISPSQVIELRHRRNNETPLMGKKGGCPNHRPGIGCSLGDLKGPICLDYIDLYMDDEIEFRFGICLMPVKSYLLQVGRGAADQNGLHPEANDELTQATVASIQRVTDYIKGFPIIPPKPAVPQM